MTNKTKIIIKKIKLKHFSSNFVLQKYDVYFSKKLAKQYMPIVYSYVGTSGNPYAVYYRIVARKNPELYCIQYFFYWRFQKCGIFSHRYDYEPIYIYLKPRIKLPIMIVNGGFSTTCFGHKNEIRPKEGKRSRFIRKFHTKLSPSPYYPFGKKGNVKVSGCFKKYPLKGRKDLRFAGIRPKFGISFCSNVFSGAKDALRGKKLNPPLKELTDRVLKIWYFKHNKSFNDTPFGHDIANPFSHPYIKYKSAK